MAGGYRTFGSYILFKELAHDTLGHLYRAGEIDRSTIHRTVFLRTFDAPQIPAREVIAGFDVGRRAVRALTAANIASGVDYQEDDGVPALVCDYLPAQPLSTVIQRSRSDSFPMPVDNALLVLEKLSLALTAALAVDIDGQPLVHGFLHPALILVSTDGEALVTGFGIADRLLGTLDHPEAKETVHPYLAPEVVASLVPSKRGDVYSLGAILMQLLTGDQLPVDAGARAAALAGAELAYDDRPLPEDLRSMLARAVATRAEERYSSAADFKQDLDRLLYGGAYSPTTFNLALFMDRLFRAEIEVEDRERADEMEVAASALLDPEPLPEPEPSQAPVPEPRRARWPWFAGAAVIIAAVTGTALWPVVFDRPPPSAEAPPTPTAAELESRRLEQERQLQAMVQEMVQRKMAEREQEIREELLARQARIEELQRRLMESERRADHGQLTEQDKQQQQDLERQLAAEEETQRLREAEFAADQQRILEQAAVTTATATSTATPEATEPVPSPTRAVTPTATELVVTSDMLFEPSQVDTLPAVLKESPVSWPRVAVHSRRRGLVIVQALINAEGRVEGVTVLRADDEGFGIPQAVIEAVRSYRFKPATKNGVPVRCYATVAKRYRFNQR